MKLTPLEKAMFRAIENIDGLRVLWKMTGGNLDKARATVKALVPHYTKNDDALKAPEKEFEMSFDYVMGELNGGVEVEWYS